MKREILILSTLLAFVAVAAASVQTDYDRTVDFSTYHTYSWGQVQTKDSLWADRIKQGIDQQLQGKGWKLVTTDADVIVLALGDSHTQEQEQTFYSGGGWRWGSGVATTSTYTTKQGLLVISMFDYKTKKLVWRGTATGGLSDKPDKNIDKVKKAISKMLANFPPKK